MNTDRRVLRPIPPTPHCPACAADVYRWRGSIYRTADAARKAWREAISPAIVAALRTAAQECTEAEAIARAAFVADTEARIAALRAEADRLAGMIGAPMA